MGYKIFLLLLGSLLFFSCTQDDEQLIQNSILEKIIGEYSGNGFWINGHDEGDQINFILSATVSKKDDDYSLVFDSDNIIHIPQLDLNVYSINENKYYKSYTIDFNIMGNRFISTKLGGGSDNYFYIPADYAVYQEVRLSLTIKSLDHDSVYYICYRGRNPL